MLSSMKTSNQQSDIRKYQCPICLKHYKASNHLREHMTLHSDKTNYKCKKCQMEFKAPGAWRNHMRKEHGFECPKCSKVFPTLTLLRDHRKTNHRDFKRTKLEDEVGMIDKNEDITGSISNKNIIVKKEQHNKTAVVHVKKVVKPARKSIVKKILEKSRMNSAVNNQKTGKYVCNECGFRYVLAKSLQRHLKNIHQSVPKFSCDHCDYTTNKSNDLKQHNEQFHSKVKKSNRISIKKEKADEDEYKIIKQLNPTNDDDENGDMKEDGNLTFNNNSFLNSTEKSTKLNYLKSAKAAAELKISTSFSLISKKDTKKDIVKIKPTNNTVSYECCECKINYPGNTELWDHLLSVHYHKMKNNTKKS